MPSPDENFPHNKDRTFHQRCLSQARDEPAETPLAPATGKYTLTVEDKMKALGNLDRYDVSELIKTELITYYSEIPGNAFLSQATMRQTRTPCYHADIRRCSV